MLKQLQISSASGGVLYQEPAGWKRFSLKCKDIYDFDLGKDRNKWMDMSGEPGEWAVAYHGTAMKNVPLIIDNGFRAGQHFQVPLGNPDTRTGDPIGAGAIFCTPNLKIAESYSNGNEDGGTMGTPAAEIDGHTLFFAFQCRVRPSAIRRPERPHSTNNDEEVMGPDGVFEWVVNSPDDIRPYGILVRDKAGADHRTLQELIMPWGKWNKEHKPRPLGFFDNIPGSTHDPAQVRRSHAHAVSNIGPPVG